MTKAPELPIYKVGIVAVRHAGTAEPQVMLVRPKPKQYKPGQPKPKDEDVLWVLPRGSRCYKDARGDWQDIRNDEDAARVVKARYEIEPLTTTLLREAKEEAGVPADMLHKGPVYDFGVHDYRSSAPGNPLLRIQWYVLPVTEAQVSKLDPFPPDVSAPNQWLTLQKLKELTATKGMRGGYLPIAEGAVQALGAKKMPEVVIPVPARTR